MTETIKAPQVEVKLKPGNGFWFGNTFWRILEVNNVGDCR